MIVEVIAARLGRSPSAVRNKAGMQGVSLRRTKRAGFSRTSARKAPGSGEGRRDARLHGAADSGR